ncbi:MAG: hypothetical protein A3E51_21220 [Burkholderiales bacterium RIFCSPHIGHO2_12_FULL_67_38]|nr:MAG: hypothetical protein A3I64_09375 [Burkholderiales bacterium RIFCSPLOWO2_02_FULL_67_64]OGB38227.1 MAG: hypothetical protein A3E51_21220 [Burkholderiales bacterium RIFCSPHIGHO2_12_FULL_67_38]
MNIQDTIERALKAAGLNTRSGPMRGVTETIRRALSSAGLGGGVTPPPNAAPAPRAPGKSDTIDVVAREVATPPDTEAPAAKRPATEPAPPAEAEDTAEAAQAAEGQFLAGSFSAAVGSRAYKLYLPPQAAKAKVRAMPLVVMLHGCTQSADDFAAGTQMNRLADQHGFLVLYPEQAVAANASRCWNWFRAESQAREGGEAELIADMVQAMVAEHPVDAKRVFVAGLSAGAAMAVILGETYPELFAAVGAHSGLPYAAAHDISSALSAMKGHAVMGMPHFPGTADDPRRQTTQAVPTIVFHGDHDRTVKPSNAEHIEQQALGAHAAQPAAAGPAGLSSRTEQGVAPGGRGYTRTVHSDASGQPRVEVWTLHGAGHAWSGGDAAGSYTDSNGPDASAEMLRFFMAQPAG